MVSSFWRRFVLKTGLVLLGAAAFAPLGVAQPGGGGSTPLATDLKKVVVGSWAEYAMSMGAMNAKARWALVARDAKAVTIEMTMEGGPMAQMGGKMTMKMIVAPDPTSVEKPVKQIVMQLGENDPMEMPAAMAGGGSQKFEKPDPKKLVGKETLKTPAGTFATQHYQDKNEKGTVDMWVLESVGPLGLVKTIFTPKPGAPAGPGTPPGPVTMELTAQGKGAKAIVTKPAGPFNPAALMGGMKKGPPPAAPVKPATAK